MHRLFVAIRPPRALRAALLGAMGGVAHARWQSDEQLHLTLRFIGEVDRHAAEDVAAALGTVHHSRFDLALDGIGQFDRKGRIDALWVGVTPQEPLKVLHNKVDQALARVGIRPESRAYLPHITIARFGRNAGSVDGLMTRSGGLSSGGQEIDQFCLYESSLSHEGSVYSIVERYPLG
jgi:2'-5' RNA ligase